MISKVTNHRFSFFIALAAAGIACSSSPATKAPVGETPGVDARHVRRCGGSRTVRRRRKAMHDQHWLCRRRQLHPGTRPRRSGSNFTTGRRTTRTPMRSRNTLWTRARKLPTASFPDAKRGGLYFQRVPQSDAAARTTCCSTSSRPMDSIHTSTGPRPVTRAAKTRNLFGAQTPVLDSTTLTGRAPENDGLAVKVPAHRTGRHAGPLHQRGQHTHPARSVGKRRVHRPGEGEVPRRSDLLHRRLSA